MITQAIAEARRDQVLRELVEWTELREMCLGALTGRIQAGDLEAAMAVVPVRLPAALTEVPGEPGAVR
jgi:hypothetical protein